MFVPFRHAEHLKVSARSCPNPNGAVGKYTAGLPDPRILNYGSRSKGLALEIPPSRKHSATTHIHKNAADAHDWGYVAL
jgi:hypothetical protein